MTIDSSQMSSMYGAGTQKEAKPAEPQAPQGGNIEGKQPPAEPPPPPPPPVEPKKQDEGMKALGVGGMLDTQG